MSTNHRHIWHGCEHKDLKFCKHCQVPYCNDCGKEWKENYNTWLGPYYGSTLGGQYQASYNLKSVDITNTSAAPETVCKHEAK